MAFLNVQSPESDNFAFPNICVEAPYSFPNCARLSEAIPNVLNTFVSNMPAHNLMTQESTSSEDEGGNAGVFSGIVTGSCMHTFGSATYFVNGIPGTRWLDPTIQNLINAEGFTAIPSQDVVMIFS